jgi:hypothetical protein
MSIGALLEDTKQRVRRHRLKLKVVKYYGDGEAKCANCDEDDVRLLSIDHINGGGNKHRREQGIGSGTNFYRWLVQQDFPDGYKTLCLKCNMAKTKRLRKKRTSVRSVQA